MLDSSYDQQIAALRQEAEAARAAGDLPAAAFGYAQAIALLPPTNADPLAYELRLARAICLRGAGDYAAEADELAVLSELARRLADPARRVDVVLRRADLLALNGNNSAAQLLASTALTEARIIGAPHLEAASLATLADLALRRGDEATATTLGNEALMAFAALDDQRGVAQALRLIGMACLNTSRQNTALAHLETALELCRTTGDRQGEALTLNAIGSAVADHAAARTAYQQGLAIAEAIGDRWCETMLANNLGIVYVALGLYGQARDAAHRAVRLARALGAREMLAICLETLGRALAGLGRLDQARVALREAYALAESVGNSLTAAIALISMARADLSEGQHALAAPHLERATTIFAELSAPVEQATALAWRAAAHLMAGEVDAARATSAKAVALLEDDLVSTEFPLQEIWWQRFRALAASTYEADAVSGKPANYPRPGPGGGPLKPDAAEALGKAWEALHRGIATSSDGGLRRSYLGRVGINRVIVETVAWLAVSLGEPPPSGTLPNIQASLQAQLTRMLAVTARLNELRDATALREMLLDEVVELSGAERLLLVIGARVEAPEVVIGHGAGPTGLTALHEMAIPLLHQALRRRRAILIDDLDAAEESPLAARSAIAVPLISGARIVGAIYADVRVLFGRFTPGDVDLLGLLGAQAATALENARLYAQTLRAKVELEQLVAERTADLRAANKALEARAAEAQTARAAAEAASTAKSVFLANVSHELRTPLNAVIGFAQILERDQHLTDRQHELARIIAHGGSHLLTLINDVLDLARIEAGGLTITPTSFDLHQLFATVDELFRLQAAARQLDFAVLVSSTVPRYVVGDQGRLRQVLINLLGNAIKFTTQGHIVMRVMATEEAGHLKLSVVVEDTGEGIAPEELNELFQPFKQTASGRRAQEGTGLGLALSYQLVRLMGGDIVVCSTRGAGTIFQVEVWLDRSAGPPETQARQSLIGLVTAGRRYKALVADHSWQSRTLLVEWLRDAGLEVWEAIDGNQALDLWATWHPHIVLIDMQLPTVDGDEVLRQIRESPAGRATVMVAITAGTPADGQHILQTTSCDAWLLKPVGYEEILGCVARLLGLDLRYSTEQPVAERPPPLTPADLAELPDSLRTELRRAAIESDPALVEAAIAHIRAGWPALGARLSTLANEFQFEQLDALMSK